MGHLSVPSVEGSPGAGWTWGLWCEQLAGCSSAPNAKRVAVSQAGPCAPDKQLTLSGAPEVVWAPGTHPTAETLLPGVQARLGARVLPPCARSSPFRACTPPEA